MSSEKPNRIPTSERDIYLAATKLADGSERVAFLAEACGDDDALRSRVCKLLAARSDRGDNLLANVAPASGGVAVSEHGSPLSSLFSNEGDPKSAPPEIDRYRIIEKIGQGGMGTVYMAEQRQPVRRKVALKVIKRGMDSEQVVARFEAERQALALMNHPNIAGVLDAGMTDDGRPFFVMELVRGIPITEYCDRHKLSRDDRLKLFKSVCNAVQHAHQKGVIHRDLKPSNILVELHDVNHVPKVIDFGVAKATSQRLTDKTLYTLFSQMIGTPLYMSPEQAELSGLDVDTRSDIYSLGVLLYELLTGTTPFDHETFKVASLDEMRRIIREDEPPRPSQKISTLDREQVSTIAERQSTDVKSLTGRPVQELDWIVVKTLEKDRARRYESASALANDIERYLADEPVLACPPSLRYRLSKFAARRKGVIISLSAIFLSLVIATITTTGFLLQANEVAKQSRLSNDEIERVNERLRQESQAKSDALDEWKTASAIAEERFQIALSAVDGFLIQITDEEALQELQFEPLKENLLQSALPFLEQLKERKTGDHGASSAQAQALVRIAAIQNILGENDSAITTLDQALQVIAAFKTEKVIINETHRLQRDYLQIRGFVEADLGRHQVAVDLMREADQTANLVSAKSLRDSERHAKILTQLSRLLDRMDLFDEATEASQRSASILRDLNNQLPANLRVARGLIDNLDLLAGNLARQGKVQKAVEQYTENIRRLEELAEQGLHAQSTQVALALANNSIASPLRQLGKQEEAREHLETAVELSQQLMNTFPEVPRIATCWANCKMNRGSQFRIDGNTAESVSTLESVRELMEDRRERFGKSPEFLFQLARCYGNLSVSYRALDETDESLEQSRRAENILEHLTQQWPEIAWYRNSLAVCLSDRGTSYWTMFKNSEAIASMEKAAAVQSEIVSLFQDVPAFAEQLADIHNDLGYFLSEVGREDKASEHFKESYTLCEDLVRRCPNRESSCFKFAVAVQNSGNYAKAVELCEVLMERFPENKNKYRRIQANAYRNIGMSSIGSYEDTVRNLNDATRVFTDYFANGAEVSTDTVRFANCHQVLANEHARAGKLDLAAEDLEKCLALFEICMEDFGATHTYITLSALAQVQMCRELVDDSEAAGQASLRAWSDLLETHASGEKAYEEVFQIIADGLLDRSSRISIRDASVLEGDMGTADLIFTITRVGDISEPATVDWATNDHTATAGEDYVDTAGTFDFAAGQATQSIVIAVTGDASEEDFETLSVVLSNPTKGSFERRTAVGTILNDDTSITISDVTVVKGETRLAILSTFVQESSSSLSRPRLSTFGPDANGDDVEDFYVFSAGNNRILRYCGATGESIDAFVSDEPLLENAFGLAFSPTDGDLYVASGSRVLRFDRSTGEMAKVVAADIGKPLGVAFIESGDRRGELFITESETKCVLRYDGSNFIEFISAGSGGLDAPGNAVVGPDGNLYVSSRGTLEVLKYSLADGQFIEVVVKVPLSTLAYIEFGSDGLLYASGRTAKKCCDNSLLQIDPNTGMILQTLQLGRDGWSFTLGPEQLIYNSGNSAGDFIDVIGPASNAAFALGLTKPSAVTVTVDYSTEDVTATAGSDYFASSGTVSFEPGETDRVIAIRINADDETVDDSEFRLNLSQPAEATLLRTAAIAKIQVGD